MADTAFGPRGWTPERLGSLDGKTFLITGANSGTGFQASRILLRQGAHVVMLNRNPEKSAAAIASLKEELGEDTPVSFVRLDLAVLASVRQAAAEVLETVPRIDALVCNAAIAQVPTQKLTVDGFESQLGTNHYGHFLLCGLLHERVEASKGRIVVVASLGYTMGIKTIQFDDMNWDANYHPNNTYCHSKLAQMMFAYELQDRLAAANKDVEVYVCHPGSSATSLIATSGSSMMRFIFWLMSLSPMVQSAEKGAYPELMCATEEGLEQRALYGPTGRMEWVGPVGTGTLEPYAHEKQVMQRLWTLSEKELTLPGPSDPGLKCILFGGTGEVGGAVARALVASAACAELTLLGRRPVAGMDGAPGVKQVVVDTSTPAFENEVSQVAKGHDAAISCIGVGAGTASMSEEQLLEIELHVFGRYARGCKAAGIDVFLLLSAVGVDERSVGSRVKYSRVAGRKYVAALDTGFGKLAVFQPGTIVGNKHTPRWVVPVMALLPDRVGWGTIHQDQIARAFVAHLETGVAGQSQPVVRYGNAEMKGLAHRCGQLHP